MHKLAEDLKKHVKIFDVSESLTYITCEVDRIQSTARSIVHRIAKAHGKFKITSSTKDVNNLGFTKVIIER